MDTTLMRIPKKMWLCVAVVLFLALLPMLWVSGSSRMVGKRIQDVGIRCCGDDSFQTFTWAISAREPVAAYMKRLGKNPAHFTGWIVPITSGNATGEHGLWIEDGKFDHTDLVSADLDTDLNADFAVLKSARLREMLAAAQGDWRIVSETGHFVDPPSPFSGAIELEPEHVVGWRTSLTVKDDRIISSKRKLGIYVDD